MTENLDDPEGAEMNVWYERKSELMASVLGDPEDWVMYAIIPYEVGGLLDQYYFRSSKSGTAMATKELSLLPDKGSSNDRLTTYELVAFMRQPFSRSDANNSETESGRIDMRIARMLNVIARYSVDATLNRYETCEIPISDDRSLNPLVIFDEFAKFEIANSHTFGLLAVIEIFPSEFEYKQENGGDVLIELLKQEGVYPFTDPDRSPVV